VALLKNMVPLYFDLLYLATKGSENEELYIYSSTILLNVRFGSSADHIKTQQ
jgi:hypothetical protein